jgi:hypothetical protein
MINLLKVGVFKLTDLINPLLEPWIEFKRPLQQKYPETLAAKEKKFMEQLLTNSSGPHFGLFNGELYAYHVDADFKVTDIGDMALHQGLTTAMYAWRYAADTTDWNHELLLRCVRGIGRLMQPPGESKPRAIRGILEDGRMADDISNDGVSGLVVGLHYAYKHGDGIIREKAAEVITWLFDELADNKYAFVNKDGKPTTYGRLINGIMTDPLNASLCLAILKLADIVGISGAGGHYEDIYRKYGAIAKYPLVRLRQWDKPHHAHRAALHLSILADLETDHDRRERYRDGLDRIWQMEHKSVNSWIYFVAYPHLHCPDKADLAKAKQILREFTVEDKVIKERVNSTDPAVQTTTFGGHLRSKTPLPPWRRGSQDNFWTRIQFMCDDWIGQKEVAGYHNGVDFLSCYWRGRSLGIIDRNE